MHRAYVGRTAPDGGRRSLPYNTALIAVFELREADTELLSCRVLVDA